MLVDLFTAEDRPTELYSQKPWVHFVFIKFTFLLLGFETFIKSFLLIPVSLVLRKYIIISNLGTNY